MKELRKAARELNVQEPGTSDDVISQAKLRQWEQLQDEMHALQQKFANYRSEMHEVMKSGASVSVGKRGVESGIRFRRHPRYKQALIDAKGENYQQKVLNATEYKPYYYVRLITKSNGNGTKGGE